MSKLSFYLKYAWRSVQRGGQRTFFATLCVAVGVAALVALLSLSASIRDTLVNDIQIRTGGDIVTSAQYDSSKSGLVLSPAVVSQLNDLKAQGKIDEWTARHSVPLQLQSYFGFPPTLYIFDPITYPLFGKVELVEAENKDFRALLSQPNVVILSKDLFEKNGYKLGQEITIGSSFSTNATGKNAKVRIAGVARTDLPGLTFDSGLVFGFAIVSNATASQFLDGDTSTSNLRAQVYVRTKPATDSTEIANLIQPGRRVGTNAGSSASGNTANRPFDSTLTALEAQERISENLKLVNDLLSYVGLLAILIGGIGVVNTMLVVIGRRASEIATIKSMGLKNRQTTAIFTLEALILGVMGSILGVIIGVGLGYIVKGVAEGVFLRPLNWGLYPAPIIVGILVGIITSGVFGFLPAYAAGRVRPGIVLRQQSTSLPRLGFFTTAGLLILMSLALGFIGGVLINNLLLGVIIGFITLIACLILTALMWIAVWLFGKLPAPFGISFRMAMRSFSRNRGRTATTLLVMAVGLFFITFILITADSIKTSFQRTFEVNLGFNVFALNLQAARTEEIAQRLVNEIPGIKQVYAGNTIPSDILSVDGVSIRQLTPGVGTVPTFRGGVNRVTISGRGLVNGQSVSPNGGQTILQGRNLTPADSDRPVLLVTKANADTYQLKVGSKVETRLNRTNLTGANVGSSNLTFEVIGIVEPANSNLNLESGWVAPFKIINDNGAAFSIMYMLVDRPQLRTALTQAQTILVGGFFIDVSDLVDTFTRILDQTLAFPLLLSLLSLFSGAILVANNVALAMLERRTELGVLKAIGAKRRRLITILLWESGLVGLLGGLIGVGLGIGLALAIPFLLSLTGGRGIGIPILWSPVTAGLLVLLGIGLAIVATIFTAWQAVQEKPLVVLRYE